MANYDIIEKFLEFFDKYDPKNHLSDLDHVYQHTSNPVALSVRLANQA